jgi:site-specific recombinase XerD
MGPRRVTVRARDTEPLEDSMQKKSTVPLSAGALGSPAILAAEHDAEPLNRASSAYLRFLRSRNRSPWTLKAYRDSLAKFAAWTDKDLPTLAREDMERWFDDLWGNLKPASVLHHHKNLRAFFRWCAADGLIDVNPMAGIPEPRVKPEAIEPFSPQQIAGMFRAANDTKQPRRDQAIIALLVSTGIRASELCGVRREDIAENQLRIRGKGSKQRWVGLTPQTETLINLQLTTGAATVFDLKRYGLYWVIRRLADAAGVTKAHPHRFRDTFAVRFLENGGGIDDLQVLLGHSNITMTLRYIQWGRAQRAIAGHMKYAPGVGA